MNGVEEIYGTIIALLQWGRNAEAAQLCEQALRQSPGDARLHRCWGCADFQAGNIHQAAERFTQAVHHDPTLAEAWDNLRLACHELGDFDRAEVAARRCLELAPHSASAANGLGAILRIRGDLVEAERWFCHALECDSKMAEAHNNLGTILQLRGDIEGARNSYEQALTCRPQYFLAQSNLATVAVLQNRITEASAMYEALLAVDPNSAPTHHMLGSCRLWQGRVEEAQSLFLQARRLDPNDLPSHLAWLMCRLYSPASTPDSLLADHREFARCWEPVRSSDDKPLSSVLDPERPLRVGCLSGDFGDHTVGRFAVHVLEHLDRRQVSLHLYSERDETDEQTERFRRLADTWQVTLGRPDHEVFALMREDQLDVLLDLAGLTQGNRLKVIMQRPAPVQLQWIGYPCTSGLSAYDGLIGDAFQNPAGSQRGFRERLWWQTPSVCCFEPPSEAPEVNSLPAPRRGSITFGCLNNPAKLSDPLLAAWAEILRRQPDSRLLLRYRAMGDLGTQHRILDPLTRRGISRNRIEFRSEGSRREALETYHEIDVALDSYPYSGGMTTCEALWMGVPVVTCGGLTMSSRHSLGHLSLLRMEHYITATLDEYVERAVSVANNWESLSRERATLRERMRHSPLCDSRASAEGLLAVVRGAWREYVDRVRSEERTRS